MGSTVDHNKLNTFFGQRFLEPEQVANVVVSDRSFQLNFYADRLCVSAVDDEVDLVTTIVIAKMGELRAICSCVGVKAECH